LIFVAVQPGDAAVTLFQRRSSVAGNPRTISADRLESLGIPVLAAPDTIPRGAGLECLACQGWMCRLTQRTCRAREVGRFIEHCGDLRAYRAGCHV